MPNREPKRVSIDDILYGFDVLLEYKVSWNQRWKGMIMQQNPLDAFAIQRFLWQEKPDAMIEFGTDTGGAAVFFAEIMTAYNPNAHVITMDIEDRTNMSFTGEIPEVKAYESPLWGKAVRHIVGRPADARAFVGSLLAEWNSHTVFLNEDGDHHTDSVLANLETFHDLIPPCGWILIQDTKLDRLWDWSGPMDAQQRFLKAHHEYSVNRSYEQYLYTQHAQGWLRKDALGYKC